MVSYFANLDEGKKFGIVVILTILNIIALVHFNPFGVSSCGAKFVVDYWLQLSFAVFASVFGTVVASKSTSPHSTNIATIFAISTVLLLLLFLNTIPWLMKSVF